MMNTIRNKLWIWGHPENSLFHCFGIEKESHVSPLDGIDDLGARNLFYVPMGRLSDRKDLSEKMNEKCGAFGWSIENPDQLEQYLQIKPTCPRFQITVFDDFFRPENEQNNASVHPAESLKELRKRVNAAGLELWVVYYERDIDVDLTPYLDCFDGITFWFWSQPGAEEYETMIKRFIEKTPGKRRMIGCYLYDFGREKSCDPNLVVRELNRDTELIRQGVLEGIILHTNAVGGCGEPGYEAAKKWVKENGDNEI